MKKNKKVKLVCGVIFNQIITLSEIKEILEKKIGKIDFESKILDFNYTDYYNAEMGTPLKRAFFGFSKLKNQGGLYRVKVKTGSIEKKFARGGKRKVNLDPGYITQSKVVLFSTKNFSHRIYMGKSIYGEITLRYEKGEFTILPWTFPDFRTPEYGSILKDLRDLYISQLSKNGN